ncbi:Nucleoid-associated protein Lsr2 [Corynebacterium occultum]|uniref:Nucleoid-associated protein Lsr2 n=1 Tax=Corynebacterium occultum TaxID=2675219 RepID=A0A6B8WQP8_9CORY|nr:Lsr2 family protein [Corynebacterium occultum]QGU08578.1 Nucleoid-associated protein Lsr2 [Corynebacterium occultum]
MARREITQYFDDLDDTPLEEHQLHVVRFSYEGSDYILDLSEENAEKFREMVHPYLEVARKVTPTRGGSADSRTPVNSRDVRRWALEKGLKVANRGKIPFEIIEAYQKAHA